MQYIRRLESLEKNVDYLLTSYICIYGGVVEMSAKSRWQLQDCEQRLEFPETHTIQISPIYYV